MPDAGRRRTPGLRREEVAVLAGVGLSWYTWLEQGRKINVSDGVLDAISRALLLSEPERRHLYLLAGLNPPELSAPEDLFVTPELQRVLADWMPRPAVVLDRLWNINALNDAARAVFGYRGGGENSLITFFTSTRYRNAIDNWEDQAAHVVAEFRGDAAQFPDDPDFQRLANKLISVSPEFAELWSRHKVGRHPHGFKTVIDPAAGELAFEYTRLPVVDRPGDRLFLFNGKPGTRSWDRLNRLMDARRPVDAS